MLNCNHVVSLNALQRLAICSGWLLKTYLSTVTKRNSEDKTLYLHLIQPLQIAFVSGWHFVLLSKLVLPFSFSSIVSLSSNICHRRREIFYVCLVLFLFL